MNDIPDIEGDRPEGIITLPVLLGAHAAWAVSLAGSVAAALLPLQARPTAITGVILIGMTASVWPYLPQQSSSSSGDLSSSSRDLSSSSGDLKKVLSNFRQYGLMAFSLPSLLFG